MYLVVVNGRLYRVLSQDLPVGKRVGNRDALADEDTVLVNIGAGSAVEPLGPVGANNGYLATIADLCGQRLESVDMAIAPKIERQALVHHIRVIEGDDSIAVGPMVHAAGAHLHQRHAAASHGIQDLDRMVLSPDGAGRAEQAQHK